ncbi:GFA family protein [Marinibacterium sp. SX1]|uniref:GFA family protein n=1 Tax=Marinibacterium sp. SX1 TaxID=3388424 RepID=UPI003D178766
MAETRDRTGGCSCGAVRFAARDVPLAFGICHCETCRRWTGSALLGVTVPEANVTWQGADRIARRQSSSFAERGWCRDCGSPLFFRFTGNGAPVGGIELPIGLLDDTEGMFAHNEIFIDHKPAAFGFAENDRQVLTRAECAARFPLLDKG